MSETEKIPLLGEVEEKVEDAVDKVENITSSLTEEVEGASHDETVEETMETSGKKPKLKMKRVSWSATDFETVLGPKKEKKEKPKGESSSESSEKKKPAPFLLREINIVNHGQIDHISLLEDMHKKFQKNFLKWRNKASWFGVSHLIVTIIVVLVQLSQIIIFQVPEVTTKSRNIVAVILPTITSTALALQLKLGWDEKRGTCKRAAGVYHLLTHQSQSRINMYHAGGEIDRKDTVKLWNTALLTESRDIPANLTSC